MMALPALDRSPDASGPDLDVFPEFLRGKRILVCTESFGPVNGVSRTTLMIVNHLRSHGALVAVVAPENHTRVNTFTPADTPAAATAAAGGGPEKSGAAAGQTAGGPGFNEEVRLTGWPLPFNPELSVVYPVRLSALYERTFGAGTPPDLIYCASPASLGFQVMLQLRNHAPAARPPLVANFQTDLAGYCRILFPAPLGAVASWTFARVQAYLFSHASVQAIFYPSRSVRRYLEGISRIDGAKMSVLRRGVSSNAAAAGSGGSGSGNSGSSFGPHQRSAALRASWGVPSPGDNGGGGGGGGQPPPLVLFTCARLAGEKGFGFLARAAAALDARGLDFVLVVVGGNRNAVVEREVRDMFGDEGSPSSRRRRVVFAGFQTGEALAAHYASADLFLHCSVTETFGLVVLEAMASGVAVVARDAGGPSDIVEDGVSGRLVPPEDLGAFVDAVMRLAGDAEARARLARGGLEHARQATWDKIGNRVAWKMAELIARREAELPRTRQGGEGEKWKGRIDAAAAADAEAMGPWQKPPKLGTSDGEARLPLSMRRLAESRVVVDAKLIAGLLVIFGVWGGVSVYLVFITAAHFAKKCRLPAGLLRGGRGSTAVHGGSGGDGDGGAATMGPVASWRAVAPNKDACVGIKS